jgi:ERCC4-type nuclease
MQIIIDSREQTPWAWEPHLVQTRVCGLDAGDYALEVDTFPVTGRQTLAVSFAIERKSLDDFIGTISSGWDRFREELYRMREFPARIVIVEGSFEECCFGDGATAPRHSHSRIMPEFIAKRTAELALMGVTVIFAGNAGFAAAMAYRIFRERLGEGK